MPKALRGTDGSILGDIEQQYLTPLGTAVVAVRAPARVMWSQVVCLEHTTF